MARMVRKNLGATLALTIGAMLTVTGVGLAPRALAAPAALTDPAGDTIDRNTNDKLASARTDIVSATVDSGAQGIVLSFKTQEMADPTTDPNWTSLNTFVSWQVDSTGDGKVDDLIRYSLDRDKPGALVGEVTHWSGPGQPAKHCDAQATFDATNGYVLTIPQACMGNPASISYRAQLTYDTDPKQAKPPLAFDVLPDTGLAGPVPIAAVIAPTQAPPAAPGAETPAAGQAAPPATAKPGAATAKPSPKPATKPTAPARTPAAANAPKPATAPAAPTAVVGGELAATGTSMARWLGALGGAFLLLGGLGLMTPADRRRRQTI